MNTANDDAFFIFYPHAQLVRGAAGAAVHDLFSPRIFWMRDTRVARALAHLVGGERVDEAALAGGLSASDLRLFLLLLADHGLGTFVDRWMAVTPYRPGVLASQAKKHQLTPPGGRLTLEVADRCVYACSFCASRTTETADACSCAVWPSTREPAPLHRLVEAIALLAYTGVDRLIVRGGEPFLEPERLWAVLDAAATEGMACEVHTTGYALDEKVAQRLAERAIHVVLLVAGKDADPFDAAVAYDGAFAQASSAIACMNAAHVAYTVKVPVSPGTVDDARETAAWAVDGGAQSVAFFWHAASTSGDTVHQLAGPRSPATLAVPMRAFIRNAEGDACHHRATFISADGWVTACPGMRLHQTSLHDVDMGTVLRERRVDVQRAPARSAVDACHGCEFRFACTGCAVRTRQCTGSFSSRFASCNYSPDVATWRVSTPVANNHEPREQIQTESFDVETVAAAGRSHADT